jgi:hypothetical protein
MEVMSCRPVSRVTTSSSDTQQQNGGGWIGLIDDVPQEDLESKKLITDDQLSF